MLTLHTRDGESFQILELRELAERLAMLNDEEMRALENYADGAEETGGTPAEIYLAYVRLTTQWFTIRDRIKAC